MDLGKGYGGADGKGPQYGGGGKGGDGGAAGYGGGDKGGNGYGDAMQGGYGGGDTKTPFCPKGQIPMNKRGYRVTSLDRNRTGRVC